MCVFPFIPCYKNEKCVSILQFIYKTEFPVCLIVVYMTAYVLQQLSFFIIIKEHLSNITH